MILQILRTYKKNKKLTMEEHKMRATGIIRRIDDLGRIVIPKEIRKTMHIRESDPLEIFTEKDGNIILKKYSPIGEMGDNAQQYVQAIASQIPHTICICDQDSVIAAAGPNAKKLIGKLLHEKAEEALSERKILLTDHEKKDFFPLIADFPEGFHYLCLSTIIAESEAVGFVCILSAEDVLTENELQITQIAASFLGKQLEA